MHDALAGRDLLDTICSEDGHFCAMDKAYEGDETRAKAIEIGFVPVVPPKSNRLNPWEYDEELYKRRNEIERFFLRIKRFRKVFTRYDTSYTAVVNLAMIFDVIFSVNRL